MAISPAWLANLTVYDLTPNRWQWRGVSPVPEVGQTVIPICWLVAPGTETLVDPDGQTLTAVAHGPDGSTTALVVQRLSVGIYPTTLTLTLAGDWTVRYTGLLGGLPIEIETVVPCKTALF